MKAAVAVETAAEVAVGTAVGTAAAAVELAVVERKRNLGLVEHRRWPWESFPCPF